MRTRIPSKQIFGKALRELGYVEGQNIAFEFRSAEGKADQLPLLAAELVRLKVDVIVALYVPCALAAKKATLDIPIVIIAADPVETGIVASLANPGGNITGVSLMSAAPFLPPSETRMQYFVPRHNQVHGVLPEDLF